MRTSSPIARRSRPGRAGLVITTAEALLLPNVCDVLDYRRRIGAIEIFLDSSDPPVCAPRAQHAWHIDRRRVCPQDYLLHEAIIEGRDSQLFVSDTLYVPPYPGQRADAVRTRLIHPIVGMPKT